MDPLLTADPEMMEREADKDARRKIQFSVPSSVPLQLDPRQVEMWVLGENGVMKAQLVHMATYQPPSLKAVQMMAEAHLKSLDREEPSSGEEEEQHDEEEKQQTALARNSREESKPLTGLCDLLGSSSVTAELYKDETTEPEEGKGE